WRSSDTPPGWRSVIIAIRHIMGCEAALWLGSDGWPGSPWQHGAVLRGADCRNDGRLQRLGRDRAGVLVDHHAAAIDHEGLGPRDHAPLDAGPAVAIHANRGERVAVAAEEAAGVGRLVLVVDAVEAHSRLLLQRYQLRVLLQAGRAPRGPE